MKRPIIGTTLAIALLMSLAPGAAPEAEAGSWRIGKSIRIGGAHFSLAFGSHHSHYRPSYYYRTSHKLHYKGYGCGKYCFKSKGHYYHHPTCSLVGHHFGRYDFNPVRAWGYPYGSSYGYRDYGHRDYGYRGRGHRDYGGRDYYDSHRNHDPRYCPYR